MRFVRTDHISTTARRRVTYLHAAAGDGAAAAAAVAACALTAAHSFTPVLNVCVAQSEVSQPHTVTVYRFDSNVLYLELVTSLRYLT